MSLLRHFCITLSKEVVLLSLAVAFGSCYYKICDETCLMNDPRVSLENKFDAPCEDNVSFVLTRSILEATLEEPSDSEEDGGEETTGSDEEGSDPDDVFTPEEYREAFGTDEELPTYDQLPASIALHDPIFPEVRESVSEPITFSLTPTFESDIEKVTLLIRKHHVKATDLLSGDGHSSYPDISDDNCDYNISWQRTSVTGSAGFDMFVAGREPRLNLSEISFETRIEGIPADNIDDPEDDYVTFVKYRFAIKYKDIADLDLMEISFALQNYHKHLPQFPAPVYAQGDMSLVDILFIPSTMYLGESLDPATTKLFWESCGSIVRDNIFQEPILIFWRKHFNFWINHEQGEASDYRYCDSPCSHKAPSNYPEAISPNIEILAFMHKDYQQDFSYEGGFMSAGFDNTQNKFFVHELGHAAFGLFDEYGDGAHGEERTDYFPNNWVKKRSAKADAVLRHKTEDDVRQIQ